MTIVGATSGYSSPTPQPLALSVDRHAGRRTKQKGRLKVFLTDGARNLTPGRKNDVPIAPAKSLERSRSQSRR